MAKGLPYFKFVATEWLTGDISFEDFDVQGLFIQICALYWQRDGILSEEDIMRRYKKPTAFNSLTDRFISVSDGFIKIAFLDEQLSERLVLSKTNSKNGKKGGRPKTIDNTEQKSDGLATENRTESEPKANESNKEEEKNKNKTLYIVGKRVLWEEFYHYAKTIKEFYKPELDYAIETTYTEWAELNGHLSSGREIKEWKKTLRNTMPHLKPIELPKQETEAEFRRRTWLERNGGTNER